MKEKTLEEGSFLFEKFCLFVEQSLVAMQEVAGRAVVEGVLCFLDKAAL